MVDGKIVKLLLESVLHDPDQFWAHSSRQMVIEFPFAPSIGFPARLEGYAAIKGYVDSVREVLSDLTLFNITPRRIEGSNSFVVEFSGTAKSRPGYDLDYIALMDFEDDKLVRIKEYWNTAAIAANLQDDAAAQLAKHA